VVVVILGVGDTPGVFFGVGVAVLVGVILGVTVGVGVCVGVILGVGVGVGHCISNEQNVQFWKFGNSNVATITDVDPDEVNE
jgi:hypothetical protein